MNALHDKAFENGLLTITPDFRIIISSILHKQHKIRSIEEYFLIYLDEEVILPLTPQNTFHSSVSCSRPYPEYFVQIAPTVPGRLPPLNGLLFCSLHLSSDL